ncbi:hypothetical protein ACFWR6_28140 [Streptomyces griseus]|uniref:hypothetical protein n=1 Tax=Streptomyces griseus TaxID=1911 RepID=UPI0036682C82
MNNETDSLLCVWVEPWGTDHWMRPGEVFTVVTEADAEEASFDVVVHDQGISVWVNAGFSAEVIDQEGRAAVCGHQRPDGFDADSRWLTAWEKGRTAKPKTKKE